MAPGDALIDADGALLAWGEEATRQAARLELSPTAAQGWLLAPALVDPHSVLEQPLGGRAEDLNSLAAAAAAAACIARPASAASCAAAAAFPPAQDRASGG